MQAGHRHNTTCADNNYNSILLVPYGGFTAYLDHYYILNNDNNADIGGTFICPETRNDWKVTIHYYNEIIVTNSGVINVGKEFSQTDILQEDMDLTSPVASTYYKISSSTFSLTRGTLYRVRWHKDVAEAGGLALNILAMVIEY